MTDLKSSTAILVVMLSTPAFAEPTVALGLSFSFGSGQPVATGISARILSDNRADRVVAVGGVTYFIGSGNIGVDAGLGYNFDGDISTALTYDFLNNRPVFSLSAADIC